MGDLSGRRALVTGGGAGIGQGICRVLAEHGAEVVVLDRELASAERTADLVRADGGSAWAVAHDVTDWDAAGALVARLEDEDRRPIDILVNNAGLFFLCDFEELSRERHERLYDVNVHGVFAMCRAVLPSMKRRGSGKIVNVASVSGRDPNATTASYGSSKSAVLGMTKSLAKEFGPHGINVNAVCPSLIMTPMHREQLETISRRSGRSVDALWAERVARVPLRRAQDPRDVGEAVAFLSSERARNITGQGLSVCGGLQMMG
jgi:NAD(P)-dependent dehydrogenase (short-subunit alcohol dehydrogenase family)